MTLHWWIHELCVLSLTPSLYLHVCMLRPIKQTEMKVMEKQHTSCWLFFTFFSEPLLFVFPHFNAFIVPPRPESLAFLLFLLLLLLSRVFVFSSWQFSLLSVSPRPVSWDENHRDQNFVIPLNSFLRCPPTMSATLSCCHPKQSEACSISLL